MALLLNRWLIITGILTLSLAIYAQKNYTISGYIQDKETGEKLIGASIYEENTLLGTTSNSYGFFSITLPEVPVKIVVRYVGYATYNESFELKEDKELTVKLNPSIDLDEVEIIGEKVERIEESTQMSTITIPVSQIKSVPALFGEVDVLKTIQLLPGVQSGGEGTSGLYVRGGGPDQNLILLDGTPVYNAYHLFGFFSVFNADAIRNVELIKGGFPARYGGRLSSVLDINLKEGNMYDYHAEGSVGIIASRLTVEGPIIKDKTSFIVSGRRTYVDILMMPFVRMAAQDQDLSIGYYFYDLNAKINHKIGKKDRLYLSFYLGDDKFYYIQKPSTFLYDGVYYEEQSENKLGWGNQTMAFRWNRELTKKLFSNLTLTHSRYNFYVDQYYEEVITSDTVYSSIYSLDYLSGIVDYGGKLDFDFMPSPNHYVKFGIGETYHTFKPGATTYQITNTGVSDIDSTLGSKDVNAHEFAAYIEDDYKITKIIKANLGLHYSGFLVNGTYYQSLQPRVSTRFLFKKSWSIKASYAMMQQYLHLLTNSTVGLPTDLWVPATDIIPPQRSNQVAFGIAKTIMDEYEFSVEGYYKTMNNLISYKDGASFLNSNTDWQDKVEVGRGWSYGVELFAQKKVGDLTGWVGYTLSWSNRQFDNINFGEIYPYKYDRRHDISIVMSYKINKMFDIAGTWVFGTGNAITLPVIQYYGYIEPNSYYYYDIEYFKDKNGFRMASYHRLDFGVNCNIEHKAGFKSTITAGVYNLYNRKNPFYYYVGYDNQGYKSLIRVSLFQLIPSLSYSFKF